MGRRNRGLHFVLVEEKLVGLGLLCWVAEHQQGVPDSARHQQTAFESDRSNFVTMKTIGSLS